MEGVASDQENSDNTTILVVTEQPQYAHRIRLYNRLSEYDLTEGGKHAGNVNTFSFEQVNNGQQVNTVAEKVQTSEKVDKVEHRSTSEQANAAAKPLDELDYMYESRDTSNEAERVFESKSADHVIKSEQFYTSDVVTSSSEQSSEHTEQLKVVSTDLEEDDNQGTDFQLGLNARMETSDYEHSDLSFSSSSTEESWIQFSRSKVFVSSEHLGEFR